MHIQPKKQRRIRRLSGMAAVLLALGLGFYALGTAVFSRRDLPL